jgi:Xaa-Pro dipeptidase
MTETFDRLAFAPEEYLTRRDALRALMTERGIAAVVLTTTENTYYLTGFGSLAYGATALVMRADGKAVWVMRRTELSNIRALADQLWANEGLGVTDGQVHAEVLEGAIADLVGTNAVIGVEFSAVQPILRGFLGPLGSGRKIVDATGLVEHLRRIKSPAEIALLKQAGAIAAQSCRDGFAALHEGMTDSALAVAVTDSLLRNGSGRMAQMPNVCAGPRTARAHVTWCGAPIRRADVINIEPAASIHDYHTPIYRIYSLGPPLDVVRRMFDTCRQALDEGYARVRPGMTSHEAARIFESVIEKAGFAENMVTRPAYSIGAAFPPGWGEDSVVAIRQNSEQVLEEGMCFHVVPCLYMDGVGCVPASMPSVLTAKGFEPLADDEVVLAIKD